MPDLSTARLAEIEKRLRDDWRAFYREKPCARVQSPQADIADLLAEVHRLRARVAELEARERWVPVGERLPEEKTTVVVRRGDGTIGAASTCRICGKFHSNVTHWRTLPEGPK